MHLQYPPTPPSLLSGQVARGQAAVTPHTPLNGLDLICVMHCTKLRPHYSCQTYRVQMHLPSIGHEVVGCFNTMATKHKLLIWHQYGIWRIPRNGFVDLLIYKWLIYNLMVSPQQPLHHVCRSQHLPAIQCSPPPHHAALPSAVCFRSTWLCPELHCGGDAACSHHCCRAAFPWVTRADILPTLPRAGGDSNTLWDRDHDMADLCGAVPDWVGIMMYNCLSLLWLSVTPSMSTGCGRITLQVLSSEQLCCKT